jgi:hypothetical protein
MEPTVEVLDALIDGYKVGIKEDDNKILSAINRIAVSYVGVDKAMVLLRGAIAELGEEMAL